MDPRRPARAWTPIGPERTPWKSSTRTTVTAPPPGPESGSSCSARPSQSVAIVIPSLVVGIIGAVVIVIGVGAGKVMSMAGYGHDGHHAQGGSLVDAPDESGTGTVGKS